MAHVARVLERREREKEEGMEGGRQGGRALDFRAPVGQGFRGQEGIEHKRGKKGSWVRQSREEGEFIKKKN